LYSGVALRNAALQEITMKSPWNLLTKFTARRKAPRDGAAQIESTADNRVVEKVTTHDAVPAALDKATSESKLDLQSSASSLPITGQSTVMPLISVKIDVTQEDDESIDIHSSPLAKPASGPDDPKSTLTIKGKVSPKRSKIAGVNSLSNDGLASRVHEGVSAQSTMPSFVDEAASVDEEIKRLRTQLAHKLILQNAQLRKMLERFDRS
jgi:hypothetical protein